MVTVGVARRRTSDRWLVVGGSALTVLCAVAAGSAATGQADRAVFLHINALPDMLYRPLWLIQLIGVLGAPAVVAAIACCTRRFRLALALALLIPAKQVVERQVIKDVVHHARPGALWPEATLRDVPIAGMSFPSGHAMIVFGMVALLGPYLGRRVRIALVTGAVLAVVARIYLGAHTPLDVLGGAGAGLAVGGLINIIVGVPPGTALAQ